MDGAKRNKFAGALAVTLAIGTAGVAIRNKYST